jgi:hypothetical protein
VSPRWNARAGRALALALAAGALAAAPGPARAHGEREPDARAAASCQASPAPNCFPETLAPFPTVFPDGIAVTGELSPNDTDFFALQLSAGQLLLVALFDERGGERTDTRIAVFSEGLSASNGALVKDNDDGGPGYLSRLAVPIGQGGTWKVALTGYGDDDLQGAHLEGRDGPVRYTLVLAVVTSPAARVELDSAANDALAGAQLLPPGGAVLRGTLDGPAAPVRDRDHFALDVTDGDELTVSLFDLAPGGANGERSDSVIAVFDGGGALVPNGSNDDGGPGFLSSARLVAPAGSAGRWKVGVSGYGDDAGASGFGGAHISPAFDYALVVTRVRDNCPHAANPDQSDVGGVGSGSGPDGIGDACQCGDVSGDGRVTLTDAVLIIRAKLSPPTATLARPELCDVGGSAGCTMWDAVTIQRALLKPPTAAIQPVCAPAAP